MTKEDKKPLQEKFIQLRVLENKSFEAIAKELNISKQTALNWYKEFEVDIKQLQEIEKENIIEKYKIAYKQRLESVIELYQKVKNELMQRDLTSIGYKQLFDIYISLENIIDKNLYLKIPTNKLDIDIMQNMKKETLKIKNNIVN